MPAKLPLLCVLTLILAAVVSATVAAAVEPVHKSVDATYDVVIYGGTPAGVTAAVAAARHGQSVVLVEPQAHVGGVVSGGLVATDIGSRETVGGLADDFLRRAAKYYLEKYGSGSKQVVQCKNGLKYEPHVAEMIFEQMLAEQKTITIVKRQRLRSVEMDGRRIASIEVDHLTDKRLPDGSRQKFVGRVFVDASYEGDLMAAAHVPYRVGRESRQEYGELLAGIMLGPKELLGTGDHRTQAYNYRVSLTFHPENRALFPKPEHYDPEPWQATYGVRIKRLNLERFGQLFTAFNDDKLIPNDKLDTNWCDLLGGSEGYAEGDWETRAHIEARHRDYFLSLLYYLQNDPELPAKFHADAQNWGLPLDEFIDNGHFPFQIYVREARRMLGRYVLSERDLTRDRFKPDGICAGSYGIDCHWVSGVPDEHGHIAHEGGMHGGGAVRPYDIPYACLTPHEVGNLLVPVCLSASHVAYCSLRMEPVYMMLGHAAGDAAYLALNAGSQVPSVQQVDVTKLRKLLAQEGAVLDAGYQPPVRIEFEPERPLAGQEVSFRAVATHLKDPISNSWWNFLGTGEVHAEGNQARFSFPAEKVYTVSLIVADKAGRKRLVTADVPVGRAIPGDVTVDSTAADLFGRWQSFVPDVCTGIQARRDQALHGKTAPARARFQPQLPHSGRYLVCFGFPPAKGQASNLKIKIKHADGLAQLTVNQRASETPFPFKTLGEYRFSTKKEAFLEVSNGDADGRVVLDAARWIWLGE